MMHLYATFGTHVVLQAASVVAFGSDGEQLWHGEVPGGGSMMHLYAGGAGGGGGGGVGGGTGGTHVVLQNCLEVALGSLGSHGTHGEEPGGGSTMHL